MAVRRHFVHFIKAFLKFGSFTPMVGSWNLHTFRALFIAVHITFIFEMKYSIWPPNTFSFSFLHSCHVFLLFGAFKAILSKCLAWSYVYWFLRLLIQQKCWHQQKNAHVSKFFYHDFYVSGHFEYFYFCWFSKVLGRKLLISAALISEFTAFPKSFSLVFLWVPFVLNFNDNS